MSNSIKPYKITCAAANTAYNVVTGTTDPPTTVLSYVDKGMEATVQNQTSGTIGSIGGSNVVSVGGLLLIDKGGSQTYRGTTPSSIQAGDFWVSSDTAGTVILFQLKKFV